MDEKPLPGRQAQAARNDAAILAAARTVFLRDPSAPISAVAAEAGVGISALYHRYAGKEELLRQLCVAGLVEFISIARGVLTRDGDPWQDFVAFVTEIVIADVHAITVKLAGTFTPDAQLGALAEQASELTAQIFDQVMRAGVVRPELRVEDLGLLFEQLTAVRASEPARTRELRHRYLAILLDGVRVDAATGVLPGPAPGAGEFAGRWAPRA
ncbi:TetR/AcrR family transcriptional regulator [Ruania zhangjianzhongii]|uniref:TetR/AcrR family transcriptional regulator n=1 Tax=Ruania zhangjianzhongii TaxID=2603206 RepID=UPI0011C9F7AA|nr:TetR/AcrR family transcriptional regulator [Ruania zhangjianzhongii]